MNVKESNKTRALRFILKPYFAIVKPKEVVRDVFSCTVCEVEYFDRLTGISVGYWSYGVFNPNSLFYADIGVVMRLAKASTKEI